VVKEARLIVAAAKKRILNPILEKIKPQMILNRNKTT
jgi:hypothetical protein